MWEYAVLLVMVAVWMYAAFRFPIPLTELEQDMTDAPEPQPVTIRKKPIEVKAMQWDGSYESAVAIIKWGGVENFDYHPAVIPPQQSDVHPTVAVPARFSVITLEGPMNISLGDWVIEGVQGEYYPCKPDILLETYNILEHTTRGIDA